MHELLAPKILTSCRVKLPPFTSMKPLESIGCSHVVLETITLPSTDWMLLIPVLPLKMQFWSVKLHLLQLIPLATFTNRSLLKVALELLMVMNELVGHEEIRVATEFSA